MARVEVQKAATKTEIIEDVWSSLCKEHMKFFYAFVYSLF